MGLLDRALQLVQESAQAFNEGAQIARTIGACNALISTKSRDEAAQELLQFVDALSADQWQDFKLRYLNFTLTVINPEKRIRATELYAFMNLLEFQYYQRLPLFLTNGGVLA
jgi:hypothetical protein